MYLGKNIFTILGLICSLALLIFLGVNLVTGRSEFYIPFLLFLVYFIYVGKTAYGELIIYIKDKKNGIEFKVLELIEINTVRLNHTKNNWDHISIPMATFIDRSENKHITLSGNYKNIKLMPGSLYDVSYLKYSRILISIKAHIYSK